MFILLLRRIVLLRGSYCEIGTTRDALNEVADRSIMRRDNGVFRGENDCSTKFKISLFISFLSHRFRSELYEGTRATSVTF